MKARPILFSASMVRALLDGSKTQTRRVARLTDAGHVKAPGRHRRWHPADPDAIAACPYGQPGDLLYVKEALRGDGQPGDRRPGIVRYALDGEMVLTGGQDHLWRWKRPTLSVHYCPRWASRLTLRITDVRVQRVQEISEEDARAEGVPPDTLPCDHKRQRCEDIGCLGPGHRAPFSELWDSINAKRGHGWDANPWVWAITFTVERRNVDDVLAGAGEIDGGQRARTALRLIRPFA